jgi:hypothetical protein
MRTLEMRSVVEQRSRWQKLSSVLDGFKLNYLYLVDTVKTYHRHYVSNHKIQGKTSEEVSSPTRQLIKPSLPFVPKFCKKSASKPGCRTRETSSR